MYDKIPSELKNTPNWVCWKAIPDERSHSGVSKVPINAMTGENARSNDPATWCDFETAARESGKYSGIGFMFSQSEFFGVDIDDVGDVESHKQDGVIHDFVSLLDSYTELSQSKTGIHIICRGVLPAGGRRRGKIEMYDSGRFFVMTGNVLDGHDTVRDCTESIKPLHEKYLGGTKPEPKPKPRPIPQNKTDEELLELAYKSANGDKFRRLYTGDWKACGFNSQSEADLSFCTMLAFWTGRNADKIDRIFRSSGLMRDKWDRRQAGSTYGALTVQKAVDDCTDVYEPTAPAMRATFLSPDIGEPTPKINPRSLDDMGNARRFLDSFGDDFLYNYTNKQWYYYDGACWVEDTDGFAERCADEVVNRIGDEANHFKQLDEKGDADGQNFKAYNQHRKKSRSYRGKQNMLAEAMHLLPVTNEQFDTNEMMLNTATCAVNLKTGESRPHKRGDLFSKKTSVGLANGKDCPHWKIFLLEIFDADIELIRYIQKAVGYSLTGSNEEQCVFFLYGTGRNGKSTFLEVIRNIMHTYAMNIQPETIMIKRNTGANSDVARLMGARLVTCTEPNDGEMLNEGLIKQLTGGDRMTARRQYGNEFEFTPVFKLWMATNYKPRIRGTDDGIWRRIHLIPFDKQIPADKVDKTLPAKLAAEYEAILAWAVEGCLLWQKEGLQKPKCVQESVSEYRKESDTIGLFAEEECVIEKGCSVQSGVIFETYKNWCEGNGFKPLSIVNFGKKMKEKFSCRLIHGRKCYDGVRLRMQISSHKEDNKTV